MVENEINPDDYDKSRTVDTQTGVWLGLSRSSPRESEFTFLVDDAGEQWSLDVRLIDKVLRKEILELRIIYRIEKVVCLGSRPFDLTQIIRLLKGYGDHFQYNRRRFGYEEKVMVEVSDAVRDGAMVTQ